MGAPLLVDGLRWDYVVALPLCQPLSPMKPGRPTPTTMVVKTGKWQPARDYDLMPEVAHGFPTWKTAKGTSWLYTGSDGRWYISDPVTADVKDIGFECNHGK